MREKPSTAVSHDPGISSGIALQIVDSSRQYQPCDHTCSKTKKWIVLPTDHILFLLITAL